MNFPYQIPFINANIASDVLSLQYDVTQDLVLDGLFLQIVMVDDAMRFVSSKIKEKLKSASEGDKEQSREPDYDEE